MWDNLRCALTDLVGLRYRSPGVPETRCATCVSSQKWSRPRFLLEQKSLFRPFAERTAAALHRRFAPFQGRHAAPGTPAPRCAELLPRKRPGGAAKSRQSWVFSAFRLEASSTTTAALYRRSAPFEARGGRRRPHRRRRARGAGRGSGRRPRSPVRVATRGTSTRTDLLERRDGHAAA